MSKKIVKIIIAVAVILAVAFLTVFILAKQKVIFINQWFVNENREHMVFPGMVYLSQPTEYGTLYTKKELLAIRKICLQYGLRLYADGARLAYALGGEANDVSLKDLAQICDVFYIGGTKAGALCGEAVVFCGENKAAHFLTRMK